MKKKYDQEMKELKDPEYRDIPMRKAAAMIGGSDPPKIQDYGRPEPDEPPRGQRQGEDTFI